MARPIFAVALAAAFAASASFAAVRDAESVAAAEPAEASASELVEEMSDEEQLARAQFEASLSYRSGHVDLGDGLATLDVPESFRFLGPEDTERLLVEAWGNPPGVERLGMLLPKDVSPLEPAGWGVVIHYEDDGHVDDSDATSIDYTALLAEMREQIADANPDREEAGFGTLELVGWAAPPRYDAAAKKLFWAKELRFAGEPEGTLNYDIRVLGRSGVLVLTAVSGMSQSEAVIAQMDEVLPAIDFAPGNTYADFDPSLDEVAAYGLGALITGKLLAKGGLLKGLVALLAVGKKLVIPALIALAAGLKHFAGGSGIGVIGRAPTSQG